MMRLMVEPLVAARAGIDVSGDFASWMLSEQRRVYSLCRRMLQNADDADCATQDVFLKAYQALQKEDAKALDDPARWLTRITVNTCLDRLRSKKWQFWKRRPSAEDEAIILAKTSSGNPDAEDKYYASEISERIETALQRLTDRQRAVFVLRHFEDRSLEEIGQVLGLDTGTVKSHMFRAVSKLREELRDLYRSGSGSSSGSSKR
jgi:RNA polymerase sigma-70 factor, ECF subfamily